MKIVDIKELLGAFDRSEITFLSMEDENGKITLKKDAAHHISAQKAAKEEPSAATDNVVTVKSPLVGIVFSAPGPEAEVFVRCGQEVKKGQTLCLVEAMKMFNEVAAPCNGIVKTVLFENGQLAEFGTPLFEIEEEALC